MDNFVDFGYENGWKETPELVQKCIDLKHDRVYWDNARFKNRGYDNATKCEICKYIFHTDSSD